MAVWQFMKAGKPTQDAHFDDGQPGGPGEPGFDTAAIIAAVAAKGAAADSYNYVGLTFFPPVEA